MLPAVINGYEWDGHEIEIIRLNDEPLFNARTVASTLGMSDTRARQVTMEAEEGKGYVCHRN